MNNFADVINDIQGLKRKAKNHRELDRYRDAGQFIQEGISILQREIVRDSYAPEEKEKLYFQLSDCYGVLGGIYRRWGYASDIEEDQKSRYQQSFESYDEGFKFEQKSGQANSYNMLNRLISRIFYHPSWADKNSSEPQAMALFEGLKEAKQQIADQIVSGGRSRDVWALADLGLTNLLLEIEDPITAFTDFVRESPPDYVYASLYSTLKPLSELGIPQQKNIEEAMQFLEKKF